MDEVLIKQDTKPILRNELILNTIASNPYMKLATSENTRRAYQGDIRHFEQWGGLLPASTEIILQYLQAFAETLNPRTLSRRLTALKNWHVYQGFIDPTIHPSVSKTLTGIIRTHGKPKDKAPALLPEQLIKIVMNLSQKETLHACRDSALLQVGFFGAFRSSELMAICYEDIEWKEQGIDILIRQSKTDQVHEGQYCAIPYGNDQLCPVSALKTWLEQSGIMAGPIFRRIHRNNRIEEDALTMLSVSNILRKRAQEVDITNAQELSSHSLRRGLATAASRDGASLAAIMRQGRWKHVNTVMEYVEAAQRFEENASMNVLKNLKTREE